MGFSCTQFFKNITFYVWNMSYTTMLTVMSWTSRTCEFRWFPKNRKTTIISFEGGFYLKWRDFFLHTHVHLTFSPLHLPISTGLCSLYIKKSNLRYFTSFNAWGNSTCYDNLSKQFSWLTYYLRDNKSPIQNKLWHWPSYTFLYLKVIMIQSIATLEAEIFSQAYCTNPSVTVC